MSKAVFTGFPSPAEDYLDKGLNLQDYLISKPAATFFMRVVGNSMEGAGILSDDLLVVDRSLNLAPGDVVVAIVDGELLIRRAERVKGKFVLVDNPSAADAQRNRAIGDFEVWGIVTYVIHKMRP